MKAKISTGTYTLFERFFPKLFDLQKNNLEIGTTLIEAPFVVDFAHAKLEIERPTLALITICCFLLSFGLFAALYCYETKQRGRILGFANFWASVMFLDAFFLHCLWEDSWMFTTVFYLLDIVPTGLAGLHLCLYALNFEIPTFLLIIFDAGVFYFAYDNLNTIMVEMVYLGPLLFAGGLLVISLISQFGWTNGKWLCLAVFIQQLATISLGFEAKLVEIDPRLNNVNLFFAASSLIMLCITNHHWANFPATTKYKLMNKVEAPAPRISKEFLIEKIDASNGENLEGIGNVFSKFGMHPRAVDALKNKNKSTFGWLCTQRSSKRVLGALVVQKITDKKEKKSSKKFNINISWIAVEEEFQKNGIGSKLMHCVVKKYPNVKQTLQVAAHAEYVIKFYEKFGFKIEKELEKYWTKGYLMVRTP